MTSSSPQSKPQLPSLTLVPQLSQLQLHQHQSVWNHHQDNKHNHLVSNLTLQICIYFNFYFTPCWFASQICSLMLKIYQFVAMTSLAILSILELPRLYVGYIGNLLEKIRHLLAFWLLTILIQLPIQIYRQIDTGLLALPLERITDWIMITFIILEIIVAYFAITNVTQQQIARFKSLTRKDRVHIHK